MVSGDGMVWVPATYSCLAISGREAKRELSELKLDIERLPLISITDAIRELAKDGKQVTPGDVIRVERTSTAAGRV